MTANPAFQNFKLTLGIAIAWLLSMLAMLSWIRRLPTLAILARRRLRRAVLGQARPAATADAALLWRQNSTLPGNRAAGFRFDYLRVMLVLTPLYLWLELSFGVNLLDKIGGDVPTEDVDAIEHWGRVISGLAVALLFLKNWFAQCEKWNRPWTVRVLVSLVICVASIWLTWKVQETVIDFYVHRASASIELSLTCLFALVAACYWAIRAWLLSSMSNRRRGLVTTLAGLVLLLVVSVQAVRHLQPALTAVTERFGWSESLTDDLGRERLQAATLTLVRRGLQQRVYAFEGNPVPPEATGSAEGKAALALYPIVGAGIDQDLLARDRPALLAELMYRDWNETSGEQSYKAYLGVVADLRAMHPGPYAEASRAYAATLVARGRAAAEAEWETSMEALLGRGAIRPGLNLADFENAEASRRYLSRTLACFDCEFSSDMSASALTHELFKWTQAQNVQQMLDRLSTPEHFERGHDGETAARSYWVPIWALLFSMIGAFTHLFKIAFAAVEYTLRRTLKQVQAADSELANALVRNIKTLLALGLMLLALFIYFSDNRVTGNEHYVRLHRGMWQQQPIVGAVATHWTINAQGMIYPFTRKIRPDWLQFESDPLSWLLNKHKDDEAFDEVVE